MKRLHFSALDYVQAFSGGNNERLDHVTEEKTVYTEEKKISKETKIQKKEKKEKKKKKRAELFLSFVYTTNTQRERESSAERKKR